MGGDEFALANESPPKRIIRESPYKETGWQTLQNRRYTAKMVKMFKIHNGGAPSYLNDISSYNTRNKHNYFIPRCILELF